MRSISVSPTARSVGSLRGLFALAAALALACSAKPAPAERTPAAPSSPAAAPATVVQPAAPPAPPAADKPAEPAARPLPAPDVATGKHGAVTSAEKHATAVGRAILERGGNAVDAAIALGLALGVTHPTAANMGGGGFMVVRKPDGSSAMLDFREVAPSKASRDMYLDDKGNVTNDRLRGPRAAGISGNIAGFAMAHKKFGSLPWKDLVEPAIGLARNGHEIDEVHAADIDEALKNMRSFLEEAEAAAKPNPALIAGLRETIAMFSRPDGTPLKAGDRMTAPALATTLAAIAKDPNAFYRGPLAKKMATEVTAMGGLWTAADLAGYRPIERKPIVFDYRGYQIITVPPPSAGGITVRQIFAASEALRLYEKPWDSVDRIHLYVEALRRIYADRNQLVGDPAFVDVPMKTLLDVSYMAKRMADVDLKAATPSSKVGAGVSLEEKPQTTHFSVVDGKGMAVSLTYTLNGSFGAHLAIPGTGVLLNNQMDDFTSKVGASNLYGLVQGAQNAIAPGKRMVSSMSPTIVARGSALRAVCGSPGGPTIPTTTAQILMQILDYGRTIDQAVAGTRIHHQWLPDAIIAEDTIDPAIAQGLAARGHKLITRRAIGHANCIEVDPTTGDLRAVADAGRRGGDADAY
ncbi:MAG TPA: gamma-glutamyltransferase [Kofleriaceae bacterium]|nr:gamma-glutamyltransferase [Kofleriaceae bacterium]